MKVFIMKYCLLIFFTIVVTSLMSYSQDTYDNYVSLINSFKGKYSTVSGSEEGTMAVSETSLNAVYQYPISNYKIDDASINVSLTYSGQVSFSSFVGYDQQTTSWIKQTQKKPAWIVGVNGFAVDVLKKTGLFNNPSWLNGTSYYEDFELYEKLKKQYVDYSGIQEVSFSNKDMVWMVDGFDYCTNMKKILSESGEGGYLGNHDKIFILKSDGSLMQLINEKNGKKLGIYSELNANSKSYAVVKRGYHHDLNSTTRYPGESIDEDLNTQYDRILYYYPGDGYEYIFQEYLTPYGTEYHQKPNSDKFF